MALSASLEMASINSIKTRYSNSYCTVGFNCACKKHVIQKFSFSKSTNVESFNNLIKSGRANLAPKVESIVDRS